MMCNKPDFVCCHFQQLIPFVEDDGSKHEDRSAGQSRPATEERREILEVNKVFHSAFQLSRMLNQSFGHNESGKKGLYEI